MGFMTLKTGSKCIIKSQGLEAEVKFIESGKYRLVGHSRVFTAAELKTIATRPKAKPKKPINKCSNKTLTNYKQFSKRNSVKKISDKQLHLNDFYKVILKNSQAKHSLCKVNLPGCTKVATQNHHMYKRTGYWLIVSKYFLPVCHNCHQFITEHSDFAVKNGFSVLRTCDLPYVLSINELQLLWKTYPYCVEKSKILTRIETLFDISP
jgi:hypothetical protein